MRILKYRKTDGRRLGAGRHARKAERQSLHVRRGDTVQVMRGDDKGATGKILKVFPKTGRVLVEGVNIVKKHRRARRPEEQSGILSMPAPIAASNVMLLDPKSGKPTRTRTRVDADGTKERVSAKSGESIAVTR
ncbi:50S ribosomal protein L24 [Roseisolibacter sp. H3M3-2]|nr:50S ribosomal protein L24 [Roseisolibacter sp. H3M3-2]MDF1504296.1 50S ribosomal protein L24 [Roseisolibacter sp. H3M3-2]